MSSEDTGAEAQVIDAASAQLSPENVSSSNGLSMKEARRVIRKISAESFKTSLNTLEPFLLDNAGASMYAKSLKRIAYKAKEFNLEVPQGYARDAKATAKRREKQDAFFKAKKEEVLAATAEAADSIDDGVEEADEAVVESEEAAVEEGAPELVAA